MFKVLGVIPARFNSSRLPGKPLADIGGKPMIQHVYERALKGGCDDLIVATDHQKIYDAVKAFGGKVIATSEKHNSGTLRVVEVAERMPSYSHYINIQGDQPMLSPTFVASIRMRLYYLPKEDQGVVTGVCAASKEDILNSSVAKAILGADGRVLYFSRSPIPYLRDKSNSYPYDATTPYFKHLGIYGFTGATLGAIKEMKESYLEKVEKLEQLTWLYYGVPIYHVYEEGADKFSVDTPEDLERARRAYEDRK